MAGFQSTALSNDTGRNFLELNYEIKLNQPLIMHCVGSSSPRHLTLLTVDLLLGEL